MSNATPTQAVKTILSNAPALRQSKAAVLELVINNGHSHTETNTHGRAVHRLISAWCAYADAHHAEYSQGIGDDGFLGEPWRVIGKSLHTLLNGDIGGLDAGDIDSFIRACFRAEGFDLDD